ncbi:MAG: flagellar biosynthesis protein FlhF [Lachnospiraceae bacterium]|nr:flagellar biosynthesis protein FlhF [Lachnospiraceae bacterium]
MVIRKYIATTEEEAVNLAKEELGEDVVIMNVKQVAAKGLMRLFRKPSVELTAAVDDVKTEETKKEDGTSGGGELDVPDFSKLQEAIQETNAVLAAEAEKEAKKKAEAMANASSKSGKDTKNSNDRIQEPAFRPDSADIFEQPSGTNQGKLRGDDDDLGERLSNLQELLEKQMESAQKEKAEKGEKEKAEKPYFDMIRKKLLDNEVEENYVNQILDDIEQSVSPNANLDSILAGVYQKIVLKIGEPHLIDVKSKKTKYIFFVGPTGVGKTTTIAKIAATLKLTKKSKLALITSDTYRIAAVEQLRTYANILGIPLQVVYTPEDMEKARDELRDYDLVFVDTAGRSHNNDEQREDIRELFDSVKEDQREVYLVLSATTKYRDLVKIATTYAEMTKYYLIFTKLDETDTIGNIFNIRMLTGAPLSYSTYGQNVPDDIGKTNAQNIAKQLLGGNG